MAKKQNTSPYSYEEYEESLDDSFKVLLCQEVVESGLDVNPIELFNRLVIEEKRKRLYLVNGTKPVAALKLHIEAERASRHSIKLLRNMVNESKSRGLRLIKAAEYDTHHVVMSRHPKADRAREIIFNVGIGINDYRNGVNLRRTMHQTLHANVEYYVKVNTKLRRSWMKVKKEKDPNEQQDYIGRSLVSMANEMELGIF